MDNDIASVAALVRSPVVRPGAEQWDVTSRITGRAYRIYVSLPAEGLPPPPGGYPVVYVTDADYIFHTAADTQMMLSIGMQAKPAVIVGIGYGTGVMAATVSRFMDLTPTPPGKTVGASIEGAPMFDGATFGGAEGFRRFLREELKPQIDALYDTNEDDTTLCGHSLGGLFALHVLFHDPQAYNAYVIGSPSIVWNDGEILMGEANLAASIANGNAMPRVLLTAGGLEESADNNPTLPAGMSREELDEMLKTAGVIQNIEALAERLEAMAGSAGCEIETFVFAGETHISVMAPMFSRGLRFALKL